MENLKECTKDDFKDYGIGDKNLTNNLIICLPKSGFQMSGQIGKTSDYQFMTVSISKAYNSPSDKEVTEFINNISISRNEIQPVLDFKIHNASVIVPTDVYK